MGSAWDANALLRADFGALLSVNNSRYLLDCCAALCACCCLSEARRKEPSTANRHFLSCFSCVTASFIFAIAIAIAIVIPRADSSTYPNC